jgi:hypothetical protein
MPFGLSFKSLAIRSEMFRSNVAAASEIMNSNSRSSAVSGCHVHNVAVAHDMIKIYG